jgi:hypothetical protein
MLQRDAVRKLNLDANFWFNSGNATDDFKINKRVGVPWFGPNL